jgi:hypothetical protein
VKSKTPVKKSPRQRLFPGKAVNQAHAKNSFLSASSFAQTETSRTNVPFFYIFDLVFLMCLDLVEVNRRARVKKYFVLISVLAALTNGFFIFRNGS